jgi:hypothetical protein
MSHYSNTDNDPPNIALAAANSESPPPTELIFRGGARVKRQAGRRHTDRARYKMLLDRSEAAFAARDRRRTASFMHA